MYVRRWDLAEPGDTINAGFICFDLKGKILMSFLMLRITFVHI